MRITNLLAVLVVGAGVSASVYILRPNPPRQSAASLKDAVTAASDSKDELDYEKIITQVAAEPDNAVRNSPPDQAQKANLTDTVASLYASEFAKLNSREELMRGKIDRVALPTDEKLMTLEDLSVSKASLYSTPFTVSDLRVKNDSGYAAQRSYIAEITATTKRNLDSLDTGLAGLTDTWLQNGIARGSDQYISHVTNLIADLLAVTVPADWSTLHLELINLWTQKRDIATALGKSNEDPLRSYTAFSEVPVLLEKTMELHKKMEDRAERIDLR